MYICMYIYIYVYSLILRIHCHLIPMSKALEMPHKTWSWASAWAGSCLVPAPVCEATLEQLFYFLPPRLIGNSQWGVANRE